MGKRQDLCLSLQHREPCNQTPQPARHNCQCDAYILGRIIAQTNETVCYDGLLEVFGLPDRLRGPLTLCQICVEGIRPIKSCGCSSQQWLRLDLACHVTDCCGRRAAGESSIEICVCAPETRFCGTSILCGAQVGIACASYHAPCAFHANLDISIKTVISQCGIIENKRCCASLPLYPHAPLQRGKTTEHSVRRC